MRLLPLRVIDAQLASSVELGLLVEVVHTTYLAKGSLGIRIISVGSEIAAIIAGDHLHLKDLDIKVFNSKFSKDCGSHCCNFFPQQGSILLKVRII